MRTFTVGIPETGLVCCWAPEMDAIGFDYTNLGPRIVLVKTFSVLLFLPLLSEVVLVLKLFNVDVGCLLVKTV